jgi:hypothetical protein
MVEAMTNDDPHRGATLVHGLICIQMEGRSRYTKPMRWLVFVVLIVACVFGVTACSSSGHSSASPAAVGYKSITVNHTPIRLVPDTQAGIAGWCVTGLNGAICEEGSPHESVITESWGSSNQPPITEGYALTLSKVATVSVNGGPRIPTRHEAALPGGLRAVAVTIHGVQPPRFSGVTKRRRFDPRFTPLNVKGESIMELTTRHLALVAAPLPTLSLRDPANSAIGVCRIATVAPLVGLVVEGGSVLPQVRSNRGLLGEAFLSCASTGYSADGWSLLAAILLSAAQPGATPPSLPGMERLPGHPEIFEAPGSNGGMVARRVPGAWLVVERGSGNAQRLRVLEHLRAVVHL